MKLQDRVQSKHLYEERNKKQWEKIDGEVEKYLTENSFHRVKPDEFSWSNDIFGNIRKDLEINPLYVYNGSKKCYSFRIEKKNIESETTTGKSLRNFARVPSSLKDACERVRYDFLSMNKINLKKLVDETIRFSCGDYMRVYGTMGVLAGGSCGAIMSSYINLLMIPLGTISYGVVGGIVGMAVGCMHTAGKEIISHNNGINREVYWFSNEERLEKLVKTFSSKPITKKK